MGIKQHNGNTGIDRLAELKIRSASIQLATIGAIGLNAIVFSPLIAAADLGSQNGTSITVNDGDRITGDSVDSSGSLYGVMTPTGNTPGNINLGNNVTVNVNAPTGYAKGIILQGNNSNAFDQKQVSGGYRNIPASGDHSDSARSRYRPHSLNPRQ